MQTAYETQSYCFTCLYNVPRYFADVSTAFNAVCRQKVSFTAHK